MNKSEHNEDRINYIIQMLKEMDVDGETMEYIIREVGMEEQMLRQLMMTMSLDQIENAKEERIDIFGQ